MLKTITSLVSQPILDYLKPMPAQESIPDRVVPVRKYSGARVFPWDEMKAVFYEEGFVDPRGRLLEKAFRMKVPCWGTSQWKMALSIVKRVVSKDYPYCMGELLSFVYLTSPKNAFGEKDSIFWDGGILGAVHRADECEFYCRFVEVNLPGCGKLVNQWGIFSGLPSMPRDIDWTLEASLAGIRERLLCGDALVRFLAFKKYKMLPTIVQIDEIRQNELGNFKEINPYTAISPRGVDEEGNQFFVATVGPKEFENDIKITTWLKRKGLFLRYRMDLKPIFQRLGPSMLLRKFSEVRLADELEKFFKELDCADELAAEEWKPSAADDKDVIRALVGELLHCSEVDDPAGCGKKGFGKKVFDISQGKFLCNKEDLSDLFKALMEEARDVEGVVSLTRLGELVIEGIEGSVNDHAMSVHALDYLAGALIGVGSIGELSGSGQLLESYPTLLQTVWKRLYGHFSIEAGLTVDQLFPRLLSSLFAEEAVSYMQVELFLQMYCLQCLWEPENGRTWNLLHVVLSEHQERTVGVIQLHTTTSRVYIPVNVCFNGIIPKIAKILDGYADEGSIKRWGELVEKSTLALCEFPFIKGAGMTTQAWKYRNLLDGDDKVLIAQLTEHLNTQHLYLNGFCYILLVQVYSCNPSSELLDTLVAHFPKIHANLGKPIQEKLEVLFLQLLRSTFPKTHLKFYNNSLAVDLVQVLVGTFYRSSHPLYSSVKKMWETNQFNLTADEYIEAGSRIARRFLTEDDLGKALHIWLGIQPSWREIDQSLYISLVDKIFSKKNVLDLKEFKGQVEGLAKVVLPLKINLSLQQALPKLIEILKVLNLFEVGYLLVQAECFSKDVRLGFVQCYVEFLTKKEDHSSLWQRLELTQKYDLDKTALFNDFSRYFKAIGKKVSGQQIDGLLNNSLKALTGVDNTDLFLKVIKNKLAFKQVKEALDHLLLILRCIPNDHSAQSLFREILNSILEARDRKCLRALSKEIVKQTHPFWEKFLWEFFTDYLRAHHRKISKQGWEFLTISIQSLLSPNSGPQVAKERHNLFADLGRIAHKLLHKYELNLTGYLSLTWQCISKGNVGDDSYIILQKDLLNTALVHHSDSAEMTEEIRSFYRPILTEYFERVRHLELHQAIEIFHVLSQWFGVENLLSKAPYIKDALLNEGFLPSALLLIIHYAFIDETKNQNAAVSNYCGVVERLFLKCFDQKLYTQAAHWYRFLLIHAPKNYEPLPKTVDSFFEMLQMSLFVSSLSYLSTAVDIQEFLTSKVKDNTYAKNKWMEQTYFLKSQCKFDLCIRTLNFEMNTFESTNVYEVRLILRECVHAWSKLKHPKSYMGEFVSLILKYPLNRPEDILAFFQLNIWMEKSERNCIFEILKTSEENDVFKNHPFERKECWKIAFNCIQNEEDLFELFSKESPFHKAYPKTSDTLVLSDLYLSFMRAALKKVHRIKEEKHHVMVNVLSLFNDIKDFCMEYGLKMYPFHSPVSFWGIWMYKDLSSDWGNADEKLKCLLENSRVAATILGKNIRGTNFLAFYEIKTSVLMIDLARNVHLHLRQKCEEVDQEVIKILVIILDCLLKAPQDYYYKAHSTFYHHLNSALKLPLSPTQKLQVAKKLVEHIERSSDMVLIAQELLREVMYTCLSDPKAFRNESVKLKNIISAIFTHPFASREILGSAPMERMLMQLSMYDSALGITKNEVKVWQDQISSSKTLHRYRLIMQKTPLIEKAYAVVWYWLAGL